jgi:1-acyl-sn-glycerol-3-phosphate acyltransferase
MKIAVAGRDTHLAREVRRELVQQGHECVREAPDCVIYVDGTPEELENMVRARGFRRLVVRSHACAHGFSCKNPGFMTEDRVSLLPAGAPDRFWLRLEEAAARSPSWAAVRLATVLDTVEDDPVTHRLTRRVALLPAGRDPGMQFIALTDAARALVKAAESEANGLFNAAGDGAVPLQKAFQAAGTTRVPVPGILLRYFWRKGELDRFEHNWTVSSERARRELGFVPKYSSADALAAFLRERSRGRPGLLAGGFDEWGLDAGYVRSWSWAIDFLRKCYWRIEYEGMENIPRTGRAMFVSNHRGFIPIDAVMHLAAVWEATGRLMRFLILPALLYPPFHSRFFTKLGGVVASQKNAARLFAAEDLVGIFPEGIRGAFTMYKAAYRLHDFSTSAFVKMAIENQAPIIPAVTTGHAEIFPIVGRIKWTYVKKKLDWPFVPIAPPFPLLPFLPLPSKWHVRILRPIPLSGLTPGDANNRKLVREMTRYVQHVMQQNIDDMIARRKNVFFGRILDGTGPVAPVFEPGGGRPAP